MDAFQQNSAQGQGSPGSDSFNEHGNRLPDWPQLIAQQHPHHALPSPAQVLLEHQQNRPSSGQASTPRSLHAMNSQQLNAACMNLLPAGSMTAQTQQLLHQVQQAQQHQVPQAQQQLTSHQASLMDSLLASLDNAAGLQIDSREDSTDGRSTPAGYQTANMMANASSLATSAAFDKDKAYRTQAANNMMANTSSSLYVKNLSPDADELFLYQKFSPHGALISCKIKTDPVTGKCRGVGFVNFVDPQCAIKAMQQLHGTRTAEGRYLHVTLQPPRAVRVAAAAAVAANSSATSLSSTGTLAITPASAPSSATAAATTTTTTYTLAQPLSAESLLVPGYILHQMPTQTLTFAPGTTLHLSDLVTDATIFLNSSGL